MTFFDGFLRRPFALLSLFSFFLVAAEPSHSLTLFSSSPLILTKQSETDDVKEIVTASLDKTVALWRLVESSGEGGESAPPCDANTSSSAASSTDPLCSSAALLVSRLEPACSGAERAAPVFALAADVDGAADAARLERILANSSSSSTAGDAAAAAVRRAERAAASLDSPAAPSSSSASAPLLLPRLPTVFIGGGTPSVRGWQPATGTGTATAGGNAGNVPDVILEGHAGWVRSLAASGRWLFSCGCGGIKQWDLSRAVPRCVATVSLPKGDVSALLATPTALFAGGADGSLCVWRLPTSRKNEGGVGALKKDAPPDAVVRGGAHSSRVSALAVVGGNQVVSASHDGSIALWSLCVESGSGIGGLGEEEPEECCVTHAEQEAAAAAAAAEAAEKKPAERRAKLVLVSRVSEAHGAAATDEAPAATATAAAAVAVAPASDASIPVSVPATTAPNNAAAPAAAAANKIHAAVVGSDGLLYTGGDDGLVARWVVSSPSSSSSKDKDSASSAPPLAPSPSGPLHGHGGSPVRALAAGPGDALVSGDAAGNVLLWRL